MKRVVKILASLLCVLASPQLAVSEEPTAFNGTLQWRVYEVPSLALEMLVAGSTDDPEKVFELDASILAPISRSLGSKIVPSRAFVRGLDNLLRLDAGLSKENSTGSPDASATFLLLDRSSGWTKRVDDQGRLLESWHRDDKPEPSPEDLRRAEARTAFEAILKQQMDHLSDEQREEQNEAMERRPDLFGLRDSPSGEGALRRLQRSAVINGFPAQAWEVRSGEEVLWVWLTPRFEREAAASADALLLSSPPAKLSAARRAVASLCTKGMPVRVQAIADGGYRLEDLVAIESHRPEGELFTPPLEAEHRGSPPTAPQTP